MIPQLNKRFTKVFLKKVELQPFYWGKNSNNTMRLQSLLYHFTVNFVSILLTVNNLLRCLLWKYFHPLSMHVRRTKLMVFTLKTWKRKLLIHHLLIEFCKDRCSQVYRLGLFWFFVIPFNSPRVLSLRLTCSPAWSHAIATPGISLFCTLKLLSMKYSHVLDFKLSGVSCQQWKQARLFRA